MRLSKEDGDKQESDSISNQRALIKQFLSKKPEITIVSEMADDGFSGVFFERPAFIQMTEDIKSGKINCVVVKDVSVTLVSYFFPLMAVRIPLMVLTNPPYGARNPPYGSWRIPLIVIDLEYFTC